MANNAKHIPGKRLRGRRRAIIIAQLLVALGLLLAIWLGLRATTETTSLVAPGRLGSLSLVGQVTGQEATSQMRELHGMEIGMVDGYVAQYRAGGDRAMVWVGQAESSSAAKELLERMTERIADGNESFRNLEETVIGGKEVYSVLGGGERHYYYRSSDRVIWLSIGASEPLALAEEAVETIE